MSSLTLSISLSVSVPLSVSLCLCVSVLVSLSLSPPSLPLRCFRDRSHKMEEARGRHGSLLQHQCQQLAWHKCSQPGFQIPVTIMKRLLQTTLYEACSQEEGEALILSGAKRTGGWSGDGAGVLARTSASCLSRASALPNLPGHSGPAPAGVSWVSEWLPVHWATLLSGSGWPA